MDITAEEDAGSYLVQVFGCRVREAIEIDAACACSFSLSWDSNKEERRMTFYAVSSITGLRLACVLLLLLAGVILPCRVTHHGQTTEQEASLCMELMGKQVMALEVGCSSTPNEGRDPGHRKLQRKHTCTCMLT